MQRTQARSAIDTDVSASRNDGAAMAAALRRLATLRATIYSDWSDGPASLVVFANTDLPAESAPSPARAYALEAPDLSFTLDPAFLPGPPAPATLDLRGRFDCLIDMPPPAQPAESESAPLLAVGAIANFVAWMEAPVESGSPSPSAIALAPAVAVPEEEHVLGAGAFAGVAMWMDLTAVETKTAPAVHATTDDHIDDEVFAVGAITGCLAFATPAIDALAPAPAIKQPEAEVVVADDAVGAIAGLARLLDLAPAPAVFVPPPVIDLEEVALDDFLADAVEALYAAAFDPTELYAWGASVLPAEEDEARASQLAACETALWDLPRVIPCGETFTLNQNHEIAVKITRALRIRADTLRARAFTEHVGFGVLHCNDTHLPWFPSVETPLDEGSDTVDADTQLATWGMDGGVDDLALLIRAPDRPVRLLSEAELDALLATPAARDSHELEDDWQENPVWRETFWHDVDAYLQTVETSDIEDAPATIAETFATHDIEIRDEVLSAAMHFWSPGDEADLAIDGEGDDLFLVGGGDAGVVLVEDGAIHSMRTGRGTRMGETVVSWSTDPWTDIDTMSWTRVATLAGVSQVRVEQTVTHDRAVIVAGDLCESPLRADGVRLVEATEHGPREFLVRRVGGLDHAAGWPFADIGGHGEGHRVLV